MTDASQCWRHAQKPLTRPDHLTSIQCLLIPAGIAGDVIAPITNKSIQAIGDNLAPTA
jgi:hypothetical protein